MAQGGPGWDNSLCALCSGDIKVRKTKRSSKITKKGNIVLFTTKKEFFLGILEALIIGRKKNFLRKLWETVNLHPFK